MKASLVRFVVCSACLVVLLLSFSTTSIAQTFAATGSMTAARGAQTATLLPNGLVLVAGGESTGYGTALSSAELYNPSTGAFTATGSMHTARFFHTATLLGNGLVLIAGGRGSSGVAITSAELYNPSNGTFSTTGNLNTARCNHTATLLSDGTVLIAGGIGTSAAAISSAELYNPSGTFANDGNLKTARDSHTATLLSNGTVLIGGGLGTSGNYLASAELYNASAKTFTGTGSLNYAREGHTATLLVTGSVLFAGGFGSTNSLKIAELYNPSTATFTATGSLNTPRAAHTATLLSNGAVLVAGGQASGVATSSAELYNSSTGTFTITGSLNTARFNQTAILVNGRVLLAGGNSSAYVVLSSAELYFPGPTAFINPKYIVVGVTYAPPGSSSSVTYTNTTSVGSTTAINSSFQSDVGFSVSTALGIGVPAAGIINGGVNVTVTTSSDYTQGSNSSTTNTISKASTISYSTPGTPNFAPVNSNYDFIWLWINPEILFTYSPANGSTNAIFDLTGYAFDPTDPASGEPPPSGPYIAGPHVVEIQVGCLTGALAGTNPCPSTLTLTNGVVTSGTLARGWAANEYTWPAGEGPGLTSADIAHILTFDPLVPSNNYTLLNSLPSTTSDGRFTKEPFPPNDIQYPVGAGTEAYSTVQMDTQSVASGATNTIKQAFGISEQFGTGVVGFFTATTTLMQSLTLTWTYSYLNTLTTTTTLTDALSIKGPPTPPPTYSGPIEFVAYQDNIFGTFAFVPVNP
jgi:hypothetical protein